MTRRDHKTNFPGWRTPARTGGKERTHLEGPWSTFLLSPSHCWTLQVELNEPPGEDSHRPDDAHGHEHAEQDVVQNHGNELPLLRRLQADEALINPP